MLPMKQITVPDLVELFSERYHEREIILRAHMLQAVIRNDFSQAAALKEQLIGMNIAHGLLGKSLKELSV